jgi:hypothetical protein
VAGERKPMTRRSLFAALLAPLVARFIPKEKPKEWDGHIASLSERDIARISERLSYAYREGGHTFYSPGFVVGDTITVRKPQYLARQKEYNKMNSERAERFTLAFNQPFGRQNVNATK